MKAKNEILEIVTQVLKNDDLIDALSKKVAQNLSDKTLDQVWKNEMANAKISLSSDVDLKKIADLYPLSSSEVKDVVSSLKSKKANYEQISAAILVSLGKKELASRLDVIKGDSRIANAQKANCGQPYHCGPDFYCGAQYECGWRFEFWPCVSSEIHCAHHDHDLRKR